MYVVIIINIVLIANFFMLDINECDNSSSCKQDETCHNLIGSFYCTCKKGFYANRGATNSTTDCQGN